MTAKSISGLGIVTAILANEDVNQQGDFLHITVH